MSETVLCGLCPKACSIRPGQSGECRVRVNLDGRLLAVTYGFPCTIHVDPMEKKPLFHFLPGSRTLSLATVGCNLHCKNCQNWQISQMNPESSQAHAVSPVQLAALSREQRCPTISYTYTEPLVYYEYTRDCSRVARENGLRNILVTAGYINRGPFRELAPYIDAANIDLKAFSDRFYRDICEGTLRPVLETLLQAKEAGIHVEVTNLVIPTLNDSDKLLGDLCRWVKENLGAGTPVHFSRFWPQYRMQNLPPTPEETLLRAREIARAAGLFYVYVGNLSVPDGGTTHCPSCGAVVLERQGYRILREALSRGHCGACGAFIQGVWS